MRPIVILRGYTLNWIPVALILSIADLTYRSIPPPFLWYLSLLYKLYPGIENSVKKSQIF